MKNLSLLNLTVGMVLFLLASCSPKNPAAPDGNLQIQKAVAETLSAIPTITPNPTATRYPTPTAPSLAGLFCEYQFCIGHPAELAFFDINARTNPSAPSNYNYGILSSFNNSLVIQVIWQLSPGAADPQPLLDLILEDAIDVPSGSPEVKLVHNMNLKYTPITSAATPVLPYGGAGAWVCGDRIFAWKAYTPLPESATALFDEALARFTCGQN